MLPYCPGKQQWTAALPLHPEAVTGSFPEKGDIHPLTLGQRHCENKRSFCFCADFWKGLGCLQSPLWASVMQKNTLFSHDKHFLLLSNYRKCFSHEKQGVHYSPWVSHGAAIAAVLSEHPCSPRPHPRKHSVLGKCCISVLLYCIVLWPTFVQFHLPSAHITGLLPWTVSCHRRDLTEHQKLAGCLHEQLPSLLSCAFNIWSLSKNLGNWNCQCSADINISSFVRTTSSIILMGLELALFWTHFFFVFMSWQGVLRPRKAPKKCGQKCCLCFRTVLYCLQVPLLTSEEAECDQGTFMLY